MDLEDEGEVDPAKSAFECKKLQMTIDMQEKKLAKMKDLDEKLKESKDKSRELEDEIFKLKEDKN